ncbi:SGNH/GDSL hydrolase family protein [Arachidicoccus sp.]|uniref:SGNH/GDSL hydrolase family protein n=1 Tax=Arachidicoccus sp. TaxID=1872624 RepID=UPI003D210A13
MQNLNQKTRRSFLRNVTLGSVAAICLPDIVSAAFAETKPKRVSLNKTDIILFQGDSITDFHRKKSDLAANSPAALGQGYVFNAGAELLLKYPEDNLKIYNRGVSGNKVYQLADRWDNDCIALKPDVLSILVGVNDFWHTLVNGYKGTVKTYHDDYINLLERTKKQLPDVRLILGEPYAIPGVKSVDAKWYPVFKDYQAVAKEIAQKFDATFIPYQSIYDKALKQAPGAYWTIDGVHPSLAGAGLMAQAWLEAVK